jgi:CheY-like chemotaxis protein
MTKVLVVDDNRDGAEMLSLLLQMWGYTTVSAYDGVPALELADTFRPDVILLDLAMPGLSGYEVARRLRSQPQHRGLHLIAVSGYGRTEDKVGAYGAGFESHLLRPVEDATLKSVLESHSSKAELSARTQEPASRTEPQVKKKLTNEAR